MKPLIPVASRFMLVAGRGKGHTRLNAFDGSLVSAKVGNYNLLRVSSILPPNAERVSNLDVPQGAALLIAYGFQESSELHQRVSAACAVAIPKNRDVVGVITEYEMNGTAKDTVAIVRGMAEEAMKLRGIEIAEILDVSAEIVCESDGHVCAFAGIALF